MPDESRDNTTMDGALGMSRRDVLQSLPLGLTLAPGLARSTNDGAFGKQHPQSSRSGPLTDHGARHDVDGSVRAAASDCLALDSRIQVRNDLFGRLNAASGELSIRDQLTEISAHNCDFALPPKDIPNHPRMSAISSIHFDHYNSSVTDLPAPEPGEVDASLDNKGFPTGTCLNFLRDHQGTLYGFCGKFKLVDKDGAANCNADGEELDFDANFDVIECDGDLDIDAFEVEFRLTLFDDRLEKQDEYTVTGIPLSQFWGCSTPPLNLGYFVMDDQGRVITVTNGTDVEFLKENGANTIETVETWHLASQIEARLPSRVANQTIAQVMPSYDHGYWIMALGDLDEGIPAYIGRVSNSGDLEDVHVFEGETIANGMAIDASGLYVLTDHKLYKAVRMSDGTVDFAWQNDYDRTPDKHDTKPGTGFLSRRGSGSTPTLFGQDEDLVAFTDNAVPRSNVCVHDRESGREICKQPVFKKWESANENTLVGYGDNVVVQNWYGANCYNEAMDGVKPGLARIKLKEDRSGCKVVWDRDDREREFASTPTIRLSTRTGLLYAPIHVGDDNEDEYEMAFIDFETGKFVQTVPFPGTGSAFRISHSPSYVVPGGRLLQGVKRGFVEFQN